MQKILTAIFFTGLLVVLKIYFDTLLLVKANWKRKKLKTVLHVLSFAVHGVLIFISCWYLCQKSCSF